MIRGFALKALLADKTRSVCAMIAMISTALLFAVLFTSVAGINGASTYYDLKQTGTQCHFVVKDWDQDLNGSLEAICRNNLVRSAGFRKFLPFADNEELDYNVEVSFEDKAYADTCFHTLMEGHMPVRADEIVMDTVTMADLKIADEIGAKVALDLRVGESVVTEEFYLSGWYETNHAFQTKTGQLIVSESYADIWEDTFAEERLSQNSLYGSNEVGVLLKSDKDIEAQAERILVESGAETAVDHISVNPVYWEEGYSAMGSILPLLVIGSGMIMLIGYLIIHNIFYIAAKKNAKQYGQLKTIGMSNRQLASFVRWQACFLLIVSAPVGAVLGLLAGRVFLPVVLSQTNLDAVANDKLFETGEITAVIVFSVIFVLMTTVISVHQPIRMIRKLSPIESVRMELTNYKAERKSSDGSQLHKFAFYNICRNRKSMVLLIISISLSLLLVCVSYDIYKSFDMDKYLSTIISSDCNVATGGYYKGEYRSHEGEAQSLHKPIVDEIRESGLVEDGGVVYGSCNVTDINVDGGERGTYWLNLYGLEAFQLNGSLLIEEDIDLKSYWDGTGMIEGCWLRDDGTMLPGTFHYNVGDRVTLEDANQNVREYEVLGHINIGLGALDTGISGINTTYEFYLCPEQYQLLTHNQDIMSYEFNIIDGQEEKAEAFMKRIVNVNHGIDYQSRQTLAEEFDTMKWIMEVISISLCGILAFIAIMNLANVFVSSIIVREKEIATLRSIGMTRKQLKTMLMWEVFYYTGAAFGLSAVLSLLLSGTVMGDLCNEISFLTYSMRWESYFFILAGTMLVGYGTVSLVESRIGSGNISERLKV